MKRSLGAAITRSKAALIRSTHVASRTPCRAIAPSRSKAAICSPVGPALEPEHPSDPRNIIRSLDGILDDRVHRAVHDRVNSLQARAHSRLARALRAEDRPQGL